MVRNRSVVTFLMIGSLLLQLNPFNSHSKFAQAELFQQQEPPTIVVSETTGAVIFIGSMSTEPIDVPEVNVPSLLGQKPEDIILAKYAPMFGVYEPNRNLALQSAIPVEKGRSTLKYQQMYQGIPVFGGELILNKTSEGELLSLSGEMSPNLDLSVVPMFSAEEAIAQALDLVALKYGIDRSMLSVSEPELWIYDERLIEPSQKLPELVWRMNVSASEDLPYNILILVNAEHGGISLQFNQIDTFWYDLAQKQQPNDGFLTPRLDQSATTWYVATTGDDSNECITTTTPCLTINEAIGKAANGDTILVGQGTYLETVLITKNVNIFGGWDSDFVNVIGYSIIDGENIRRGIEVADSKVTQISNVWIQHTFYTSNSNAAIYIGSYDIVIVSNSAITNNNGGIRVGYDSNLEIKNCTISENSNTTSGSGLYVYKSSRVFIQNTTITNNNATISGGGIYGYPATSSIMIEIQNSIVANNQSGTGNDCYMGAMVTLVSHGHNLIEDINSCNITLDGSDIAGFDPMLGGLNPNLGVHLLSPSSPAIDAGDPSIPGSGGSACELTDQIGKIRPIDGNEDALPICDIGAYEADPPSPPIISFIEIVSGSPQSARILTDYIDPLIVIVKDQFGLPFPNAEVTFTAPDSGASGIFSDSLTFLSHVITDSDGKAISSQFTANEIAGYFMVNVSVEGLTDSVDFSLNNWENHTWYVSNTGSDSNDCLTISSPCSTINGALGKAINGDTILVSKGTYYEKVTINKNIDIFGGWESDFSVVDGYSVIDGENIRVGIEISNYIQTSLSNLWVKHGFYIAWNVGGIRIGRDAVVKLNNSVISDNNGGLAAQQFSDVEIINCTISGNTGTYNGAGLTLYRTSRVLINNTTITNNTSRDLGGGIYVNTAVDTIHIEIQNSIIANNYSGAGPDCGMASTLASIESHGHNIIQNISGCNITVEPSDITGSDPLLGALDESFGIHPLAPTSLAIDAGDPGTPGTGGTTCEAQDQVGRTRPIDGDGDASAICDIGAYESNPPGPSVVTSISVVGSVDRSTKILTDYSDPLIVVVRDQYAMPVSGETVTFTAPNSGASGSFSSGGYSATASTGGDGRATSPQFTANDITGTFTLTASISALPTPAEFHLYNWDTQTWYVAPSGNDSNDCLTIMTPCLTIDAPLEKTTFHDGDTINVQEGTYTDTGDWVAVIDRDVDLKGGWNSDFSGQTGYTTIDGESARGGLYIAGSSSNRLSVSIYRFEVKNGASLNTNMTVSHTDFNAEDLEIYSGAKCGLCISYSTADIYNLSIHDMDGLGINNGGLNINGGSTVSIESLSLHDNRTGVIIQNSNVFISKAAIYDNDSSGVYSNWSTVRISNSNLHGNSSAYGGGIEFKGDNSSQTLYLNNVTITGNKAWAGGGIWQSGGSIDMAHTIVARNNSVYYGDCRIESVDASHGYNIIGNPLGCNFTPNTGDQIGASIFLAPAGFYGSGFDSQPILRNSTALDAGNPADPGSGDFTCETTDQRNIVRPQDGNTDGLSICDIGAFEYVDTVGSPAYIYPFSDDFRYGAAGETLSENFAVVVLDSDGSGVPGIEVTFTAPASGAGGAFSDTGSHITTTNTDENGVAIASAYTMNSTAGNYLVEATLSELPNSALIQTTNGVGIETYTMSNSGDEGLLPGLFLCDETSPGCTNHDDNHADYAQNFAIDTYLFYLVHHQRNSIDDMGMEIVSSVHFDSSYANAFWNGLQMVYGDAKNYPLADDVVAHELTHGVTDYTSGLIYYYQSGAISESFSDLWGEFVDQTNDEGGDSLIAKWYIGEDLAQFTGSMTGIRNMKNPTQYSQPDKMTNIFYHQGDLENLDLVAFDNGGVHTNSGVNNKAVYLMTDGGTFNGHTITGIGMDKVAAIYYEVQTSLLTSAADYLDLYYAVQQGCYNLVGGSEGIRLADCGQVALALHAVEMDLDPIPNFSPEVSACPDGSIPQDLFYDGFENGTGNWTLDGNTPSSSSWLLSDYYAISGSKNLYGEDADFSSDVSVKMATAVTIPSTGTTYLHFTHAFGFELSPDGEGTYRTWDGGVLEYSVDGGPWTDAKGIYNAGQSYNGTIEIGDSSNPLNGRMAFVRDSHGYVDSRYNLSTPAILGHTIKFRWRIGTDSSVGDFGWFLDDVRIYTCQAPLFNDDFSTAKAWVDESSGNVTRDSGDLWLNWTADRAIPLHYSIPIHAAADTVQLEFRFKVNSNTDESLIWVGLAESKEIVDPALAGTNRPGIYLGIDSANKIQFLSLYEDGSYLLVDGSSSPIDYLGQGLWRMATLTIDQLNWSVTVRDATGVILGQMNGVLPSQHDYYDYVMLMYDYGGGSGSINGNLDDIVVFGQLRTASFTDVPFTHPLYGYIQALYDGGYTSGCNIDPPMYCPDMVLNRAMSSVFMLRGNFGASYVPPPEPWNTFFDDWSPGVWAEKWAEGMWVEGLTAGCNASPLLYCPWDQLPRVQAAVFGLRMKYGVLYTPPAASGTLFADMTDVGYWGTKWAEQAYLDGLLPDCGTSGGKPMFCPNDLVDRAWGAYMIVKAKNLPLP